ncbi:uncharacterized protein PV09_03641 [Verruconis gallopava]|uniref:Ketoreductase (KR) domain-containing protein n=1 Tax=Verruconis gallopava TaxID=253628 RepID=A0A0D1XSS6_9PEZI|nr:uncharacterized protein PV09_03641 [Verruconis gallopava]KIW05786.1 hypothetical protein PV09_03641 [Verruconis gallopava]
MSTSFKHDFVRDQRVVLPTADTYAAAIRGGTFIVTGSNTGLGFDAAKSLVQTGASKVILAVRTPSKGEDARSKIETATGITGVLEVWQLEMASYDSILAFAKRVELLERVDAIIENAAMALDKWQTGDKGMEMSLIVNVTGTMLLAGLVMPKLKECAEKFNIKPTISIVGSGVAHQDDCRDELNRVPDEEDIIDFFNDPVHGINARYPLSKLLLLYAVREWALRNPVSLTGVVVNYVNPGLCYTELARHVDEKIRKHVEALRDQIGRTSEMGSRTLVHGAVAGEESHGKYLSECMVKEHYNPESITGEEGQKMQKRVWKSLTNHINAISPGCL